VPLKLLQELEASAFTDQSWAKAIDDMAKATEVSDGAIEVGISDMVRAFILVCVGVYLLTQKSFELSLADDECRYRYGIDMNISLNQRNRHNFLVWWRLLTQLKDRDSFRRCLSATLEWDIEQQDEWFAIMKSYADYCEAPSPGAFKNWGKKAFG
jgi:hypothetical protein